MKQYTILQYETSEYHIFESKFNHSEWKCVIEDKSICTHSVNKAQSKETEYKCKSEYDIRFDAARYERKMCADCMRELYETLG
jgi:hypothetical protein